MVLDLAHNTAINNKSLWQIGPTALWKRHHPSNGRLRTRIDSETNGQMNCSAPCCGTRPAFAMHIHTGRFLLVHAKQDELRTIAHYSQQVGVPVKNAKVKRERVMNLTFFPCFYDCPECRCARVDRFFSPPRQEFAPLKGFALSRTSSAEQRGAARPCGEHNANKSPPR